MVGQMKTVIYYFSGTGNSLALARGLSGRLDNAELVNIRHLEGAPVNIGTERVGIVFPVYAFGPPAIVRRFLEHIASCDAPYFFAVCNCAGMHGGALQIVHDLLRQKNIPLDASFNVDMPSNYIPFGGAEPEEKQRRRFLAAEARLTAIANAVAAGAKTPVDKSRFLPCSLMTLCHRYFLARRKKASKKFFVTDKCIGCGLCEKLCPVKNIAMADGKPRWGDRCEVCMGCLQWCPREAISFGREYPGRKHYHHPGITPADLM